MLHVIFCVLKPLATATKRLKSKYVASFLTLLYGDSLAQSADVTKADWCYYLCVKLTLMSVLNVDKQNGDKILRTLRLGIVFWYAKARVSNISLSVRVR